MDIRTLQAQWQLEMVPSEELPDIAAELLINGISSASLIALAGMVRPTRSEVAPVIERVFAECAAPPLARTAALWRLAYSTASRIVSRMVPPKTGATRLWQLATELDFPVLLRPFVYLAADYGEGPKSAVEEAAWFDSQIVETARILLSQMPPNGESAPVEAA